MSDEEEGRQVKGGWGDRVCAKRLAIYREQLQIAEWLPACVPMLTDAVRTAQVNARMRVLRRH